MNPQETAEALNKLIEAQDRAAWGGAIIAALGALLGAALAVGTPLLIAFFTRPRLYIGYNKTLDLFDFDFDLVGTMRKRRYITVQLQNRGRTVAKNVRVYLSKVEKIYQNGRAEDVLLGDSFQLAWPGWTFEGRELPRGVSRAVEVVAVDKAEAGWIFQFKGKERNQEKVRSYRGTYRLTLVAVSDNAEPYTSQLSVFYDGDWNQFEPTGLGS